MQPYILDAKGHKWSVRQTAANGERAYWAQSVDTCPSVLPGIVGFYASSREAVEKRLGVGASFPPGYLPIGGGYSYATLRVGMVIRNPEGREVFVQPGDDESAMRDSIEALDEISEDFTDAKRGTIAGMLLGEYFA